MMLAAIVSLYLACVSMYASVVLEAVACFNLSCAAASASDPFGALAKAALASASSLPLAIFLLRFALLSNSSLASSFVIAFPLARASAFTAASASA